MKIAIVKNSHYEHLWEFFVDGEDAGSIEGSTS